LNYEELEYAGFWVRVVASLIDGILTFIITFPVLISIYGLDYLISDEFIFFAGPADIIISWVLPAIAVIVFWITKQATPGKMAISAKIVDVSSGMAPSTGQCIGRYLAYIISIIPLGLGVFWVAFDSRKQAWHDKLAGTVVVRRKYRGPEPVRFS